MLSRPISVVGSSSFAAELLALTNSLARTSHINVLERVSKRNPHLILSASFNFDEQAAYASDCYQSHHWYKDPIQTVATKSNRMFLMNASQISDRPYQAECYGRVGVIQRLTVLAPAATSTLQLNLYRRRESGSFSEAELQSIVTYTPYFAALIRRHKQDFVHSWSKEEIEERLKLAAPILSEREISVCARIVFGLTSEGIGMDLGIAKNTVLTHRRRAYCKLRICSQVDLFRLLS
jgi:DNA-binding CsgD family transcriptional regulator